MGIKLDELIESTELNANDIMHLRTVEGLDKKIAVDNMPAADLAGEGRTTETIKDNADDITTHEADNITFINSVHGIQQGHGNGLDADLLDAAHKDIDGTLSGNSDLSIPTEKAVKTYVDAASGVNSDQLAKAWVNFNGTGVVAIRDSYNVSSITDLAAGHYRVNFTDAMPDTNYCYTVGGTKNVSEAIWAYIIPAQTTVALTIYTQDYTTDHIDMITVNVHIFGS